MSSLRVNKIVNLSDDGPVEFSKGVTVPSGKTIDGDIVISTVGVVTASSFSGPGTGLTTFGVDGEISNAKVIAYTILG
tara:strand:- start:9791 stop:10024 length:234 start_codon:yes stop_codon:yes gene_type:complete